MQYQVVARSCLPQAGRWDYYPYLVPSRDREAAERLARHAARCGYEAAILQSVTMEMVVCIARAVVERQDDQLLPARRYLPGADRDGTRSQAGFDGGIRSGAPAAPDPHTEGPDTAELDARRTFIEMGPGGDVEADRSRPMHMPSFPLRMDVLRSWLRLRELVVLRQVGGPTDGTDDEADEQDAG